MFAALLTTLLFSISAICGHRTSTRLGGVEANFWRICGAMFFLAIWANTLGAGTSGAAFPIFVLSGLAGIGLGDTAYFQALPRLGSRRTVLLTQCLIAPFATLIEWLWLGTRLNLAEIFCVAVILTGVVVALAPGDHLKIAPRRLWIGILASAIAALGGAFGAVLSRKAYFVAHAAGEHPDPGTTGYQRVIGGAVALGLIFLIVKWRHTRRRRRRCANDGFIFSARKIQALAVGSGQQPCRPDGRRKLHAMGARKHAHRHRHGHHRHDPHRHAAAGARF